MDRKELCMQVLAACRTELCQLFPGLNGAFACLPVTVGGNAAFSTDGEWFYASENLLELYAREPAALRRGMLHVLIHCLYLHVRMPDRTDPTLWSIACDLWTEGLISGLKESRLETENRVRDDCLHLLGDKLPLPETLMQRIAGGFFPYAPEELASSLRFDDHSLWLRGISAETVKKWEDARGGGGDFGQGSRGMGFGAEEELPTVLTPKPHDFRKYLQKFTLPREEMETDEESFDYIYYDLGMTRYGNLPLIEPLEYREVWRLDELAIAIDTSGSCSRETVSRFLRETYAILSARENFFRKMKVVFFQCDSCLQETAVIRSREAWERYAAKLKIRGRGGTDFRPVFREIEKLRTAGELKKPRALLYFTDGDGIYPTEKPDYETVFVLGGNSRGFELVPDWATKLIL